MENENLLKQASLGKRIIAFLIDFGLAFLIGVLLNYFVTNTYMFDAIGGNEIKRSYFSFAVDSGLVNSSKNDNGEITNIYLYGYESDGNANASLSFEATPNGEFGYEAYLNKVWYYYTDFYYNDARMVKPEGYTYSASECDSYKKYVYTDIFMLPDPDSIKGNSSAARYSSDATHPYFEYGTNNDGTPNITSKPVLRETYKAIIEGSDETAKAETLTKLRDYFLTISVSGSSASVSGGIYYNAVLDMEGQNGSIQTYFYDNYNKVQIISWECSLTACLPIYFIFMFLIPAIDKQGRSIGKFIMRFSVIREDAVLMNWAQRLGRPFFMLVLISLTLIPNSFYSIIIFGCVSLVDLGFLSLSKKGKSIHDRLFRTAVVSTKDSIFFSNYQDKEEYISKSKQESDGESTSSNYENDILDLSTINARREEAKDMTPFEDFEKAKDEETANNEVEVNLHKEEDE